MNASPLASSPPQEPSVLRSKRIAFYTDDPGEGGVAIYNHAMVCGLAKAGLNVSCIQTKNEGPLWEIEAALGVQHHWLPFHSRQDYARTAIYHGDAKEAFAILRPDVVVFANCGPFSHIAAKQVAIEQNIPYIIVEGYAYPVEIDPEIVWRMHFTVEQYRKAKAVIAVSQQTLGLMHSDYGVQAGKGDVIHYGRPAEYFQPVDESVRQSLRGELGVGPEDVLCLTVARTVKMKGYDCLATAMRQLKQMSIWKNLHFVWIGSGNEETALREWAQKGGVADRVHMLGHRWDVAKWLDACDLFILPSRAEGMPLSIMEAMAKGLPVMASAVSGVPEELGTTGRLLTAPVMDEIKQTVADIVSTLESWATNPDLRRSIGAAGKARAELMFREERMVQQTRSVIERAVLPKGDYVSPGLRCVRLDSCFPNMKAADPKVCKWRYLRWDVPHNWYQDSRAPGTGFANRDEAHILYNTALRFRGRRALEIGCWLGWSACHLALGGVTLDVIDPVLGNTNFRAAVQESLKAAGVLEQVNLVAGESPAAVEQLARTSNLRWPLIFIDGNHEGLAPVFDAAVCAEFAESDALILFHDLASPDVAGGLEYLRRRGWNTVVYSTQQIMAAAWRGNVQPIVHHPDPEVHWNIPLHLRDFKVSGS